jgi:signal transduction histidine kinase/tetratricopeptide (TPR) repeat protein
MFKFRLYLTGLSILISTLLIAQTERQKIDSLFFELEYADDNVKVDLLNEISQNYWQISLDSSFYFANEALNLAHITQDKKGISDAYNRIGNVYYYQEEYKKTLEFYEKCLDLRLEFGDSKSISNIYNNIAFLYKSEKRYGLSIEQFNSALTESINRNDKEDIASYYNEIAHTYYLMNDYTNSIKNFNSSLEVLKQLNKKDELALVYNSLGSIYSDISSFNESLNYYFEALNIYESSNDTSGISMIYNNLGIVYQSLKENEKALSYYKKALSIDQKEGHEEGQATALNNIGTAYDDNGDKEMALEYYNRALILNKKLDIKDGIATALNNIGLIYLDKTDFDKSFINLMDAAKIFEELNDSYGTSNAYNNLANLFLQQKKYENAKQYLDKASKIAKKINAKEYLIESYQLYSKYYTENNEFKKSLEYYQLYSQLSDSIYEVSSSNKISEMKVKFDTDFIKAENELLKKDNEIQSLELNRQKNLRKYWIAFTVLILAISILSFQQFSLKKKTNSLLEKKNIELKNTNTKLIQSEKDLTELNATKDKFFSIIAHDLKNPFQSLLGFSESLHVNLEKLNSEEVKEYSGLIYNSSQNLYNLLGNLLQWAKAQLGSMNLKPKNISVYKSLLDVLELTNLTARSKNIKVINSINEHTYVWADKHVVNVVFSNLINNAIKFTNHEGEIYISSITDEDYITISVKDTGNGISEDNIEKLFKIDQSFSTKGTENESGTGLGLILCKELIIESKGEIFVESKLGKGSNFQFKLPVSKESNQLG